MKNHSILQPDFIHPKYVAFGACESPLTAGGNHHDGMSDRTIRFGPSLFLDDSFLAFLVQGIHGFVARNEIHKRLVFLRLSGSP